MIIFFVVLTLALLLQAMIEMPKQGNLEEKEAPEEESLMFETNDGNSNIKET